MVSVAFQAFPIEDPAPLASTSRASKCNSDNEPPHGGSARRWRYRAVSTHGSSSFALVIALSLVLSHPGISAAGNLLEVPRTIEGMGVPTVAMADLNGDSNLDLVAGYSVLLGNGDGTFQPKTDYPYLGTLLVDLNGDSKLDLAGLNSMGVAGGLSVMFGNGDGTFGAPVSYGTRSYPRFVAAGDLNRDGAQDLVVVNSGLIEPPSVSVYFNRGDGTYSELASASGLEASEWSWCPIFLDVDLDGWEDVLITNVRLSELRCLFK